METVTSAATRADSRSEPNALERDAISFDRHSALSPYCRMIFSENRFPLFGIMLYQM